MTGMVFNIQKFCIQDGPGIRTTVFLGGCPLQCKWCANPESQNRFLNRAAGVAELNTAKPWTVAEVMTEVRKDQDFYLQSGGGMTLSGGEVLQQAEFAAALCQKAQQEGIHTAVETTGFGTQAKFQLVLDYTDLLLFDIKHAVSEAHRAGTGVGNEMILQNLRLAVERNKPVIGRIPVIPGFNDTLETAEALAHLLREMGLQDIHLLPFHQFGEKKYSLLGVEYAMQGVAQLHPEQLADYRQVFLDKGLHCSFQ